MSVVIANGIRSAEIGDPAGLKERDQPGLMLSGNSDRAGDGQGERTIHADGAVEDGVDAAQDRTSKGGQAMFKNLVDRLTFVNAANAHWLSMIVMHQ